MKAVILLSLVALTLGKETLLHRFTEFKQKYEEKNDDSGMEKFEMVLLVMCLNCSILYKNVDNVLTKRNQSHNY